MNDRRRFYLIGGRPVRNQGSSAVTRTHVAFEPDGDGVLWPVCRIPVGEREWLAEGVFEELAREATCLKCPHMREPLFAREAYRPGIRGSYRRFG